LTEIIKTAEEFCTGVELALQDCAPLSDHDNKELHIKIGLCRNLIAYLRSLPDPGIANPAVRNGLRSLITGMIWVAFYARPSINYRLYRKLVIVEALYTHILIEQIPKYPRNGSPQHSQE
jgi:hypothetical protein